jgi:glycosyltransferase involved in cell wall biosynthesis
MTQIGVLHIDIEGGFGGSSRSLFELASRLEPEKLHPVVVHKLHGPVEEWYAGVGIPSIHQQHIPQFVPRKRNSWKIFLVKIPEFLYALHAYRALRKIIKTNRISVVHLNYEGLWLIALLLRLNPGLKIISHCRTVLPDNLWSRFLVRILEKCVQHVFFISPNERDAFLRHSRDLKSHSVLWNIARPVFPLPIEERWRSKRIVVLSNIDPQKGIDRCLDLAESLIEAGLSDFRIEIFGMARSASAYVRRLEQDIQRRSLGDMVQLMGFTKAPEAELKSAFCLLRPSLDSDPWGRDVIEAVSAGIPVLATGAFEGVVVHRRTGFLFEPFDPVSMAATIQELSTDEDRYRKVSRAGMALGRMRFSGGEQTAEFQDTVERLVSK